MADQGQAQANEHAKQVKEKGQREAVIHLPQSWPHDEEGKPMCIVVGAASDLVPTVQFGNVNIGPVQIMRPVPNHADLDMLAMEARVVELLAQYVVGTERRIFQWATDPTTRIEKPSELISASTGITFGDFVARKLGVTENGVAPQPAQG